LPACLALIACGGESDVAPSAEKPVETAPKSTEASAEDAAMSAVAKTDAAPSDAAPKAPSAPPTAARAVLIVVDTLRADRLGCYGFSDQPTTPTMDRIASEGILFERFYAASPWTGASFGSILTGVSPTVHGGGKRVRKGLSDGKNIMGVRTTALSRKVSTLPELLDGVTSAAVVTNSFLHPSMGFGRGFAHYDHQNARLGKARRADATTKAATDWLAQNEAPRFFLMVHYFDPHISYDPPPKYVEQFADGPSGRFKAPFWNHKQARDGKLDATDEEKAFIRGLYNGEIRFVDDQIGALVASMKRLGMLENTWVAITADHGEEQFDHGSFDHGHRYEDEVTRVPLIVRAPGGKWRAGMRVPFSARHIDLAPTILEWFGKPPAPSMSGRSLIPLIAGTEQRHRPAYMEFNIYWAARSALFDGRYKLIRRVGHQQGWMYDLEADPGERHKLDESHPRYAALDREHAAVRKQLGERAKATADGSAEVELPPETVEALRSLGYID
jgi:arylsulfatase